MQRTDESLELASTQRARAPSFKGLKPSSEASSRAMRSNTKYNTKPERLLRRALWRLGARYRKNAAGLPGQPDIVFPSARVVIFCDGDFWHGRNWRVLRAKLARRANPQYWIAKIRANKRRDLAHLATLRKRGWVIIRLWETDIKRDPGLAAAQAYAVVVARRMARAMSREGGSP
jgi:DNA mismatch endonuclease (patch repair protein)